jgi:RecB family exonuclease
MAQQKFLERLVEELAARGFRPDRTAMVFPSRRAGLFFDRYLRNSRSIRKPLWSPDVFALNEFVEEISGRRFADKLSLIFTLYRVYREIALKGSVKSFDEFYHWGGMMLSDFEEIDLHGADAKALFKSLGNIAELDRHFSDKTPGEGDIRRSFMDFAETMGKLYFAFVHEMEKTGTAYYGLAVRGIVERLRKDPSALDKWDKVVFAGFNALSSGEEKMIEAVIATGKGEIFWDMDGYFTADAAQEAGRFFRESRLAQGRRDWVDDTLATTPKEVHIIGTAGGVSQAKVCGKILDGMPAPSKGHSEEDFAIVLPDEGLLLPVLHSIPERLKDLNVTMGFPLRNTPVYTLVSSIIELHENRRKFGLAGAFYHRDIEAVLFHPYMRLVGKKENSDFVNAMRKDNAVFVPVAKLAKLESEIVKSIFTTDISHALRLIEHLMDLFKGVRLAITSENEEKVGSEMELEYIYGIFTLLQRLHDVVAANQTDIELSTFWKILREVIDGASIPFVGEPLKGLQIMGLLETRALDFKNVIILSANEGVLPAGKFDASFIPYDVRKASGLPTYEHRDSVYAYNFYRLLKRAEKVWIVYNTEHDEIGKAGRSRFVEQLLHEFPERNRKAKVEAEVVTFAAASEPALQVKIPKSPGVMAKLAKMEFSPSSLKTYLACSLKFYFEKMLGLEEREDVLEFADAGAFGTAVHDVLAKLYEPCLGRTLTENDLREMKRQVAALAESCYREELSISGVLTGWNRILVDVSGALVDDFIRLELDLESGSVGYEILGLENDKLRAEVPFEIRGKALKAVLKGKIDRLDRKDGVVRIIDYKTGTVKPLTVDMAAFDVEGAYRDELLAGLGGRPEVVQLLGYFCMVSGAKEFAAPGTRYNLAIYPFKSREGFDFLRRKEERKFVRWTLDANDLPKVKSVLAMIFEQLFDENIPFRQADDDKPCQYCPFADMCCR